VSGEDSQPPPVEVPDAEESCFDPEERAFWLRMVAASRGAYKTIAAARNFMDRPGWKDREAALRLASEAEATAARKVPGSHGRVDGRSYRQVNVKLGEADYEARKALSIARDLPPSTMARILVRKALHEAAGLTR
jgi:hypothetical protein